MSTKKSQNYDCKFTETTATSKYHNKSYNSSEAKKMLFQQLPQSNLESGLKNSDESFSPRIFNRYNNSKIENYDNNKNTVINETLEKVSNQSIYKKLSKENTNNKNKNKKKLCSNNSLEETNISSNNNTSNNIIFVQKMISKKQFALPYCEHHKFCDNLPKKYTCNYKKCTCGYCMNSIPIFEKKNYSNSCNNKCSKIKSLTRHQSSVAYLKNAKYKSVLDIYRPKKPENKENISISNIIIDINSEINENSSIISNQL